MSFDSASPLLDIADPQQLLDLLSCSELTDEEDNVSVTDHLTLLSTIDARKTSRPV
ncbi:hypothetical protein DPMN_089812 [Dreissena polymorpha]|uniref:Uncharacterized protein n=1 Tax=Dreissena polymorpha TaxID=45954 RepID=A0A9D4KX17_DREPO|nr:hypothetical protein DPMN_089812 [Dreissena polymorpha]